MAILLTIKVVPQSGRQEFTIDKSGRLKCYLKSAPEKNRANIELIKLIASQLGITNDQVTILTGHTARTKRIHIYTTKTESEILKKLGIEQQLRTI